MSSPGLQGLRPWIIQRISAVYIGLFILYVFFYWLTDNPFNAQDWHAWVAMPINNLAMGIFLIATLWHAWIGVRDIILDYVPNVVVRLAVLGLLGSMLIACGLWGLRALFMVVTR